MSFDLWNDWLNADTVYSYVDQLNLILKVLGTPEERTMQRIGSEKVPVPIQGDSDDC